jgi:hypothetical protein
VRRGAEADCSIQRARLSVQVFYAPSESAKRHWQATSSIMEVDKRRKKRQQDEDAPGSSDEEGIDLMNSEGDSSEEEDDDDPDEEARIREGEECIEYRRRIA